MDSITEDDIRQVIRALVDAAKRGERWAVPEFLNRALGRPIPSDLLERLERMEAASDLREDAAA